MSTLIISNYLENALINHILRNTAYTDPTDVYLALFTSNPDEDGSGTEVSGGSYVRKQLTAAFDAPASGATANTALIEFVQATATWGLVSHVALFDQSSGGNLLFYGQLSASQQVDDGDTFSIAAGDLDISLTNHFSYFLANELLDHILNSANYATPGTSIYVALFTTTPGRDGTGGTEVSGGAYARKNITAWDAPSNGATANTNLEAFTTANGADWGTIVGAGIYDASTSGNLLFVGDLTASKAVYDGDTFQFAAGALDVSVD